MKDKIIKILEDLTEDNEMVQGDVVSYVPDWAFKEAADEIIKLLIEKKEIPQAIKELVKSE